MEHVGFTSAVAGSSCVGALFLAEHIIGRAGLLTVPMSSHLKVVRPELLVLLLRGL